MTNYHQNAWAFFGWISDDAYNIIFIDDGAYKYCRCPFYDSCVGLHNKGFLFNVYGKYRGKNGF